jgi:DNA primase
MSTTTKKRPVKDLYSADQIRRILVGCGIPIESEVDSDYIIFCPFHNNTRSPAGEIDKTKGTFFCFSCQKVADLVEFVMFTSARTYFESIRFIKDKEQAIDLVYEVSKQLVDQPEYVEFDLAVINKLYRQAANSDRAKEYLRNRKIHEQSIDKFELGYSEKNDMVTIPVHSPDGIAVGFVGRSIEGKDFKNTPGLPKSKVLFNLHRVKTAGRVFVVESSFDAIRLWQCGYPAVATLGANVSSIQINLLQKYFNNIVVIADNDEAGGNMKKKIIEKLGSRVSVIHLNNKYKDVGDMTDEEIKALNVSFDNTINDMLK